MNQEIINRFLRGKCTSDEIVQVNQYFKKNPGELDNYLSNEEWKEYLNNDLGGSGFKYDLSEKIYLTVYNATIRKHRARKKIITLVGSVAAVLLIFSGIYYLTIREKQIINDREVVSRNRTNRMQNIVLPDKSIVQLTPGSEIRYARAFNDNRKIFLTGKATFDVFKDKNHPFIVYCRQLATTALGTRFMIDGTLENPLITLHEGKVVVTNTAKKDLLVYLHPGQSACYIESEQIFKTFTESTGLAKIATEQKANTSKVIKSARESAVKNSAQYLKFNNKDLASVLNNISARYHVEINYPTDISAINIYISVDTSLSIETILKNICIVNNLQLKKIDDNKYYILR